MYIVSNIYTYTIVSLTMLSAEVEEYSGLTLEGIAGPK